MTNELSFDMKFATQIGESQVWEGKEILFDPDSSPAAWEHYKICYKDTFKDMYNIQSPQFFSFFNWKYFDLPLEYYNRLYAVKVGAKCKKEERYSICQAESRISGDTDFNFNEKKYNSFLQILFNEFKNNQENFKKYKAELDNCSKMHHTLLNFSLMQSMGIKEEGLKLSKYNEHLDRLDTLIYFLDCFYNETDKEKVLREANNRKNPNYPDEPTHRECLEDYLSLFSGIYDYCKKIYFIDKALTEKLIENGKKPIKTAEDVKRYMALAIEFWKQKEKYLKNLLGNP